MPWSSAYSLSLTNDTCQLSDTIRECASNLNDERHTCPWCSANCSWCPNVHCTSQSINQNSCVSTSSRPVDPCQKYSNCIECLSLENLHECAWITGCGIKLCQPRGRKMKDISDVITRTYGYCEASFLSSINASDRCEEKKCNSPSCESCSCSWKVVKDNVSYFKSVFNAGNTYACKPKHDTLPHFHNNDSCTTICEVRKNCNDCVQQATNGVSGHCVWSISQSKCISPSAIELICAGGTCGQLSSDTSQCPQPCINFKSCGKCNNQLNCAWCAKYITGNYSGHGMK